MDKPISGTGFKMMTFLFAIRDTFRPRLKVLHESGIEPGFRVLDYGCGPGSYIPGAAQLAGPGGEIFALDIHPRAVERVRKIAARRGWTNIKTIQSDCSTGLPDGYLDLVLIYDIFHDLSRPEDVLGELHRVLKPAGRLSFSDHHMKETEIVSQVTKSGLFKLATRGKMTYTFSKISA
jgi:ubiquinone/menaquinone biosynthesis C-methylase UbiE